MTMLSPNQTSQAVSLPGAALSADADGRPLLIGTLCKSCGNRMFPAAPVCSSCMSEDLAEETMPRQGALYSFTTVHVGPATWKKPFAVGYVDLTNGVRIFTHLRGTHLQIGQTVELAVAEVGKSADGAAITSFVFQQANL